ncbi:MAG: hypothetical protein L3J39_13500 [Verrucomicrobiales bacterium]|nr:hypothetical protein [Verrucomicrobiales bacterium]
MSETPPASDCPDPSPPKTDEEPLDPEKLSAEEQMALYEKSLKEDDWGHQPC